MKIGITSVNIENNSDGRLFSNGHVFNTILWYDFFIKCGYDVTLLTDKICENKYKQVTFKPLIDTINNDNNANYMKLHPELFDFDIIFHIGLHSEFYLSCLKKQKIKVIYIMLGSTYHNDVHTIIDEKFTNTIYSNIYDEIWLSPHFKYCKEYYKIRYKCENVYLCPYFWRNDLFESSGVSDQLLTDFNELKVAVVEPNIEQAKNCLIPMAICEKARDHIKKVMLFNTAQLKDREFFKKFVINTNANKEGKVSVESRYKLPFILSKYCNCIVSYVEDCDLNYVFLECFYYGIPLVHNSPMLKDYGYYYPRLDVTKGAQQIENVIKNHNKEEYIKKHRPIINKYSIDNPVNIAWVKGRVEGTIDYDLE